MSDIVEKYNTVYNAFEVDPAEVLYAGKRVNTYYNVEHIIFDGMAFYSKKPHTVAYKSLKVGNKDVDNELATMSELIAERRYKPNKFLTAKHFVFQENCNYYVVSPDFLAGKYNKASFYDLAFEEKFKAFNKRVKPVVSYDFLNAIINKHRYLEFMTEECFNQYVKFILMGIFEFSDDDSLANILFVKHKSSKKFEEMFVCDKESTSFNNMVAAGKSFSDIKRQLFDLNCRRGVPIVQPNMEYLDFMLERIKKIFSEGLLNKRHLLALKDIAMTDYDAIADEISQRVGIKKNQTQIDLYKYGGELAGEIYEKVK